MENHGPSPALFFDTIFAYQRSAAVSSALDINLFTTIGDGHTTPAAIAAHTHTNPRAIRILCDYLTIHGFLTKTALPPNPAYALTQDSAAFLSQHSPAYLGSVRHFLNRGDIVTAFNDLTKAIKNGRTALPGQGSVDYDDEVWQSFARSMMPMMMPSAQYMAQQLTELNPCRVLDVASSHGAFGLSIARTNPNAHITALDFPSVLPVTREHVGVAGMNPRFSYIEGDVFEVDLEGPYDVILVTNLFHHFSAERNIEMMKRFKPVLAPGGRIMTLEFVPNPDRISPPTSAAFSLVMLSSTVEGDAYTFDEFNQMFQSAGFARSEVTDVPQSMAQLITTWVE